MSTFTDKLVNRLMPDDQISSLLNYKDDFTEAEKTVIAEKVGRKLSSGTNGEDGTTLSEFDDTTYNAFTAADAYRWLRVFGSANGNDGFYLITEFVTSSRLKIAPALTSVETGLDWEIYREPNLEDDVSLAITQLREIVNPASDWFQAMPRGFDAANTDASNAKNEKISLKVLADDWYGSKTKILRNLVFDTQAVASGNTGKLVLTSKPYATKTNRSGGTVGGLPIHASVGNAATLFDIGGINAVTKVNILNEATGDEILSSDGFVLFGKLEDGADHAGTGGGTDVFVKFYKDNGGAGAAYTWGAPDPTSVRFELPVRKRRRDILEHEEEQSFTGSTLGDAETAQDIAQIRSALGITDGQQTGDWDWTNTAAFYALQSDPGTAEGAINALNDAIGDRQYTANNFVIDGQTVTASINALDQAIGQSGVKSKIVERVTSQIQKGTAHTLPFASGSNGSIATYKPDTGNRGLYMEVFVAGKKLIPDSTASSQDGEYDETSSTQVTFRFNVKVGQIVEYIIRDDA